MHAPCKQRVLQELEIHEHCRSSRDVWAQAGTFMLTLNPTYPETLNNPGALRQHHRLVMPGLCTLATLMPRIKKLSTSQL